jgi:hypothetical protein
VNALAATLFIAVLAPNKKARRYRWA